MTPTFIFGLALLAYAFTRLPEKYKPTWTHRLTSWQSLIGLVAIIAAIFIVMNPEFYALGILGDSAFFDLLVLAISLQLQTIVSQIWGYVVTGLSKTKRFMRQRIYMAYSIMLLVFTDIISAIQKVAHHVLS